MQAVGWATNASSIPLYDSALANLTINTMLQLPPEQTVTNVEVQSSNMQFHPDDPNSFTLSMSSAVRRVAYALVCVLYCIDIANMLV